MTSSRRLRRRISLSPEPASPVKSGELERIVLNGATTIE